MTKNWHDANRFSGLLRRAVRIAAEGAAIELELREAFTERYGKTYKEHSCLVLSGSLDYGNGVKLTVKQVDKLMGE